MMLTFIIKHSLLISLLMLLSLFGVGLFLPAMLLPLGILFVLLVLAFSIALIRRKYKTRYEREEITQKDMRRRTVRSILVLVITLLLAVTLVGLTGSVMAGRASAWVAPRWAGWENLAALASAILASFVVGYLVRWGVGKLIRQ